MIKFAGRSIKKYLFILHQRYYRNILKTFIITDFFVSANIECTFSSKYSGHYNPLTLESVIIPLICFNTNNFGKWFHERVIRRAIEHLFGRTIGLAPNFYSIRYTYYRTTGNGLIQKFRITSGFCSELQVKPCHSALVQRNIKVGAVFFL